MRKFLFAAVIWLTLFYITGAGMWANWYADFYAPDSFHAFNCRKERQDWALHVFVAAVPLFWVIGPFVTGFYEDGFNWKWLEVPCHKEK